MYFQYTCVLERVPRFLGVILSAHTKNPLHPSALTLNNINIGREVILFNRINGVLHSGRVISKPYVQREVFRGMVLVRLAVDIRSSTDGITRAHYLTEMGVIPYHTPWSDSKWYWSKTDFTVDARKRHLLPNVTYESDWAGIEEEEEEEE